MSIFGSNIETYWPIFEIYGIILEFNIFKVTVVLKTWFAAEKVELGFESDLLFFCIILFIKEDYNW